MIVISDTSCIGYLIIIDKLSLLKDNFSKIIIQQTVHKEILQLSSKYNLRKYLHANWITVNRGVLLLAKERKIIPLVQAILEELTENTTFRINKILYKNILQEANEL
jgi:predicted nucleic acid-binding protein